jgi:hypothetical protein
MNPRSREHKRSAMPDTDDKKQKDIPDIFATLSIPRKRPASKPGPLSLKDAVRLVALRYEIKEEHLPTVFQLQELSVSQEDPIEVQKDLIQALLDLVLFISRTAIVQGEAKYLEVEPYAVKWRDEVWLPYLRESEPGSWSKLPPV